MASLWVREFRFFDDDAWNANTACVFDNEQEANVDIAKAKLRHGDCTQYRAAEYVRKDSPESEGTTATGGEHGDL